MTEIIPIPVTAMLPMILFPLTGVLPSQAVAKEFLNVRCMSLGFK